MQKFVVTGNRGASLRSQSASDVRRNSIRKGALNPQIDKLSDNFFHDRQGSLIEEPTTSNDERNSSIAPSSSKLYIQKRHHSEGTKERIRSRRQKRLEHNRAAFGHQKQPPSKAALKDEQIRKVVFDLESYLQTKEQLVNPWDTAKKVEGVADGERNIEKSPGTEDNDSNNNGQQIEGSQEQLNYKTQPVHLPVERNGSNSTGSNPYSDDPQRKDQSLDQQLINYQRNDQSSFDQNPPSGRQNNDYVAFPAASSTADSLALIYFGADDPTDGRLDDGKYANEVLPANRFQSLKPSNRYSEKLGGAANSDRFHSLPRMKETPPRRLTPMKSSQNFTNSPDQFHYKPNPSKTPNSESFRRNSSSSPVVKQSAGNNKSYQFTLPSIRTQYYDQLMNPLYLSPAGDSDDSNRVKAPKPSLHNYSMTLPFKTKLCHEPLDSGRLQDHQGSLTRGGGHNNGSYSHNDWTKSHTLSRMEMSRGPSYQKHSGGLLSRNSGGLLPPIIAPFHGTTAKKIHSSEVFSIPIIDSSKLTLSSSSTIPPNSVISTHYHAQVTQRLEATPRGSNKCCNRTNYKIYIFILFTIAFLFVVWAVIYFPLIYK